MLENQSSSSYVTQAKVDLNKPKTAEDYGRSHLLTRRNPLLSPIGGKLEEEETSWGNHRLYMSMGEILLLNTDRKEAAAATAAAAAAVSAAAAAAVAAAAAAVWVVRLSLITHFQL